MSDFRQLKSDVSDSKRLLSDICYDGNIEMFRARNNVKREPCRRCQIIRLFLLMVVGVIFLGFAGGGTITQLQGITPDIFGWIFGALGAGFFFIRLILWRLGKHD